jgi:hypothetical protein
MLADDGLRGEHLAMKLGFARRGARTALAASPSTRGSARSIARQRCRNRAGDASPIDAITNALEATGQLFEDRRDSARQRQRVIQANTELRERELIKLASLASADALRRRGVSDPVAKLTAASHSICPVSDETRADQVETPSRSCETGQRQLSRLTESGL